MHLNPRELRLDISESGSPLTLKGPAPLVASVCQISSIPCLVKDHPVFLYISGLKTCILSTWSLQVLYRFSDTEWFYQPLSLDITVWMFFSDSLISELKWTYSRLSSLCYANWTLFPIAYLTSGSWFQCSQTFITWESFEMMSAHISTEPGLAPLMGMVGTPGSTYILKKELLSSQCMIWGQISVPFVKSHQKWHAQNFCL